jgi:thiamine pyrophosphokinase
LNVNIVAGAPNPYVPELDGMVIAVDRGVQVCLEKNIKIDLAVGDFDSVDSALLKGLKVKKLNKEKDETDLQVAIEEALKHQPKTIYLYGVTGGRLDHYEAALKYLAKGPITIIDAFNKITMKSGDFEVVSPDYVSFFHYSGEPMITLKGFKYPLKKYVLNPFDSKCISNEVLPSGGRVSITGGHVLMMISKEAQ